MVKIRLAVAAFLLLTVTACTAGRPRDAETRASTTSISPMTAVSTPTATQPPSATMIPNAPTSAALGATDDTCQTQNLKLTFGGFNGAGGTAYSAGYLTNVGTTTCTMIGYPGLAGLDESGNIVQHAATRNPGMPIERGPTSTLVTLTPGALAEFGITNSDTVPNSDCPSEFPIAQTQVYPPNQTIPIRVPSDVRAGICDLTVGFVQPDS